MDMYNVKSRTKKLSKIINFERFCVKTKKKQNETLRQTYKKSSKHEDLYLETYYFIEL